MKTATTKTVSTSQMAWMLKKGFAWTEDLSGDDDCGSGLGEIFWTREGGYMWDVDAQMFAMTL